MTAATPTTVYERVLFLSASAFNLLVAIGFALPDSPVWPRMGLAPPESLLMLHLLCAFILLFGLAYLWIGIDIRGKAPLIALGAAGKLAAFGLALAHALLGLAPADFAFLATGDLLYAALFVQVLRRRAAR